MRRTWSRRPNVQRISHARHSCTRGPGTTSNQDGTLAKKNGVEETPLDVDGPPGKLASADAAVKAARVHGSHIEDVDFGANAGTVFEIETKGMTTAVVWITDEEEL